ncbi:zinc finger protein 79-like [Candoia aspera]|uniref:zinc finger protein 79-like n=1 Tax=Candoia aspera TaxID=51853 RepID=UPI002FD7D382
MNPSRPPAMAAEKFRIQESTAFEAVTVYLTEEIQFDFDPYLFALSGSNLQQYCTLLSWLEMRNHKSELTLETEEGIATPLSLVHVVEEFGTSPRLYQGDEAAQTKQQANLMPLVRLQYNFAQEANLPTRSSEFFPTSENVSLFPELPRVHPNAKEPIQECSAAFPHQGGTLHANAAYAALKQHGSGVFPLGCEQDNPQDAVRFSGVAGDSSQKGHPSERSHPEKNSHPRNNVEANVSKLPTSAVCEETCAGEPPCVGSNPAVNHLNPAPVDHQQVSPKDLPTFRCPTCSHPFKCSIESLVGQEVSATNRWKRLFGQLSLSSLSKKGASKVEKPFKCPDCGKGFLHRSSIPRHQRLHKKENSSPNSGQRVPYQCSNCETRFAVKSAAAKLQRLHEKDQQFRCLFCDKSYSQKSHLKRHEQQKHQETP